AARPGRAPRTWPTSQWGAGAGTGPPGRSRSRRLLPDRGRLRVRHRRLSTLRAQGPPALVGAALGSFAAAGTNPVNRSSVLARKLVLLISPSETMSRPTSACRRTTSVTASAARAASSASSIAWPPSRARRGGPDVLGTRDAADVGGQEAVRAG